MPMNRIVLAFILFFLLSTVLPMIFRLFQRGGGSRDKAKAVVDYVQKRGYRLVNPSIAQVLDDSGLDILRNPALRNLTRASLDIADIDELDNGTGDWLAFTCTLGSKEVVIFNLSVTSRAGGACLRYKVAKIKTMGLPRFSLGRNSAFHTFETVTDRLVGKSEATIALGSDQYPEFSEHYWITGPDRVAVAAFLSHGKVRFLESAKLPGILAANANYLVYFENGVLVEEKDFDSFIAKIETIVANVL